MDAYSMGRPAAPAASAPTRLGLNAPNGGERVLAYDKDGRASVVESVRQIGSRSFFRKEGRWVESTLTPEDEAKAVVIEQFGAEYFQLAGTQPAELNQHLTMTEEVIVRLGDKIYRIRPVKP